MGVLCQGLFFSSACKYVDKAKKFFAPISFKVDSHFDIFFEDQTFRAKEQSDYNIDL